MTTPLSILELGLAAVTVLATLVVTVLVSLRLRDHLCERRLRQAAVHSPILADLLTQLENAPSLAVRRRLGDRTFLADVERVDRWIARSRRAGGPPGVTEAFPDARLVDHYLVQIRKGSDEHARAAAAGLLGWTASPAIIAPLLATAQLATHRAPTLRLIAIDSLVRTQSPKALATLVAQLDRPDEDTAEVVMEVLAAIGAACIEPITVRLGDPASSASQRKWCVRGLGRIPHHSALPSLLTALTDTDAEVRAAAVDALADHRDTVANERLTAMLLTDPVPLVRAAVARALGRCAPTVTLRFLAGSLADPDVDVRRRTIEALEQLGPAARDVLVVSLSDPEASIARSAARALQGIGAVTDAIENLASHGYDANHSEFLIDVGRAGHLDPLLDALRDPRPGLPPLVVRILARIGDPRAGSALGDYLDTVSDDAIQARVLDALRRVKDPHQGLRATRLLSARDPWLRKTAVDYLIEFGGPDATDRIARLLDDSNPWTRSSALHVFEVVATQGFDELAARACLQDPYDIVRAQAVRTLCARQAFEVLLEHDVMDHIAEERIRAALLQSLAQHATVIAMPLITRLAAFCADHDLDLLRHAAKRALRELDETEIDLLLLGSADPEQESSARWFATVAWTEASARAAAAWRDELLRDPDPRVRAGLVFGLADRKEARADLIVAVHQALDDPAPVVVRAGLATAGRCGLHELESAVSDACRHEDEDVRVDATFVQALLPNGAERVDALAAAGEGRAQTVAATAARLLMHDPAAVLDWLNHLRLGGDRRIVERWIHSEHALFIHVRGLAAGRTGSVPASILLCRNAFDVEQRLASILAEHPHDAERRLALRTLISGGSDRCLGAIRGAFFRDRAPAVRADALAHLVERNPFGRCREYLEFGLDDRHEVVRLRAIRLCAMLPPSDTADLLARRLGQGDRAQRSATVERLAALLQEHGEELLDYILHPGRDGAALVDLARVLDRCAIPVCTPVLEELFLHADPLVRAAAVRPLIRKRGREAWAVVDRAMSDRAAKVRARAVQALGSSDSSALHGDVDSLRSVLRQAHVDPDAEVRSRTALTVARLRIEGSTGILGALERDDDPRVERIARQARLELDKSRQSKTPA